MGKKHDQEASLPTIPAEVEALAAVGTFSSIDRLAYAGRVMMAGHAQKLYAHLPGVVSGDDPHDIHQMRVATRRLRASLQSTATAYDPQIVDALRKRLRTLARVLGEVRDRDVLLKRLRADAEQIEAGEHQTLHTVIEKLETADEQHELHATIERIAAERDLAHAALVAELGRKRTARLFADLNAFLSCPLDEVAAPDNGMPLLVRHDAGSAIWSEYEAVLRFQTIMQAADVEQLHDLRIACKHLRYTLELFAPALGEDAGSAIKAVTRMQEHLGDLHDADVAIAYLGDGHAAVEQQVAADAIETHGDQPSDGGNGQGITGVHDYIGTRVAERTRLQAEVGPLWDKLTSVTMRRKLARMIADL
jgi:CHAD domain-containing protein